MPCTGHRHRMASGKTEVVRLGTILSELWPPVPRWSIGLLSLALMLIEPLMTTLGVSILSWRKYLLFKINSWSIWNLNGKIMPTHFFPRFSFDSFTDFFFWSPNALFRVRLDVPELMKTHVLQGGPPTRSAPGASRKTCHMIFRKPNLSTAAQSLLVDSCSKKMVPETVN